MKRNPDGYEKYRRPHCLVRNLPLIEHSFSSTPKDSFKGWCNWPA